MSNLMQCPVNLVFEYDWDRVRNLYNQIIEKKQQNYVKNNNESVYNADTYSLGKYGAMISNHTLTDHEWNIWAGPLLEHVLPASIYEISNKLKASNLEFVNFGYFMHFGNIKEHVDPQRDDVSKNGHCNINYVIGSTDPNAKTVLFDPTTSTYESYPSTPKKTWILNSAVPHRVENRGIREIFQIKVFSPYNQVKDFFQDNGWVL